MIWFKSCAGQVLKLRQPLEWVTPLGLPVVQPYVTVEQVDDSLAFLPIRHKQVCFFQNSLTSMMLMLIRHVKYQTFKRRRNTKLFL